MDKNSQLGFTLIELMIALVIGAVLMQVVAPGFQKMIKDNHVRSEVYALRAALNTARSEAITRRQSVIVCPGTLATGCLGAGANWADGILAFSDPDGGGVYVAPATNEDDDLIVVHFNEAPDYINVRFDTNGGDPFVRFLPQGYTGTTSTLEVCDDRALTDARGINISAIGFVGAALDTDGDNIRNDHGGINFDCADPPPPPPT